MADTAVRVPHLTEAEVPAPPTRQLSFLPDPIDQAFVEFHHANPHVYRALVGLAREWVRANGGRCSMGMLFEVLRYDHGIRTRSSDDGLKLNNNFRSRYARLIAANERDLADAFETRALATERLCRP